MDSLKSNNPAGFAAYDALKHINTLFFIGLFFLFLFFGKERCISWDGSFAILNTLSGKLFFFSENRYFTGINSVFPFIVNYFQSDIHWVAGAYVISYCILPVANFLFFRYVLKDEKYLTIFLLGQCMFYLHGFFVANHDTITIYYLIFITYFFLQQNTRLSFIMLLLLIFFIVFGHFSQVISLYMVMGYVFVSSRKQMQRMVVLALYGGLLLIMKFLFFKGAYEQAYFSNLEQQQNLLKNVFFNDTLKGFLSSLLTYNFGFLLLCLLTIHLLIRKKEMLVLGYFVLAVSLSILFVSYILNDSHGLHFYTEPHYKCLSALVAIVFAEEAYRQLNAIVQKVLVASIYLCAVFFIVYAGIGYHQFYGYVANICNKSDGNVLYYQPKMNVPHSQTFLPLESTVINLLENNKCSFVMFSDDTRLDEFTKDYLQNKRIPCLKDSFVIRKAETGMEEHLHRKFTLSYYYTF